MPLPRDSSDPECFLRRDVSRFDQEELTITQEVHDRMRAAGIRVVNYEVEITDTSKTFLPELVDGYKLKSDEVDIVTYRRSLNTIAIGWHRFFRRLVEDDYPYFLFDVMGCDQYMYGTTNSNAVPGPILVDIDPLVIDLKSPTADRIDGVSLILASEINHMSKWAQKYWEAAGLGPFPIKTPTNSEIFDFHTKQPEGR